jgi:ankyrin repeat protein
LALAGHGLKAAQLAFCCARSPRVPFAPTHARVVYRLTAHRGAVDVNARDAYGNSALHMAAYAGNRGFIDMLCEAGADIAAVDAKVVQPYSSNLPLFIVRV